MHRPAQNAFLIGYKAVLDSAFGFSGYAARESDRPRMGQDEENRDKTERRLRSEVNPGMDARKGKLGVIRNLLHMDVLCSPFS